MAKRKYNTNINIKYQTPYIPKKDIPDSEISLMKKEISGMRKNLIEKQKALDRSTRYNSDADLKRQLQNLRVRDLNTNKKVWNTWNRLYSLEESNKTSVTGRNETRKRQIESLNQRGYNWITTKNFDQFGDFMEFVKENYSLKAIGSDVAATYFYENSGDKNENELQEGFNKYIYNS